MKLRFLLTVSLFNLCTINALSQEQVVIIEPENPVASLSASGGQDNSEVYTKVDQKASFPGGIAEFEQFLNKRLENLQGLKQKFPKTKNSVEFTVEADGSLTNYTITTAYGKEFIDQLAMLLRKSPKWNPAKVSDQIVRSRFTYNFDGK